MDSKMPVDVPAGPSRSLADRLLRAIYSRLQRSRKYSDNPEQPLDTRAVTFLFELRRWVRKSRLGKVPIRIVFLAGEPHGWFCLHSLYLACIEDPAFEVSVVSVGWGTWMGISGDCEDLFRRLDLEYIDGRNRSIRLETLYPDIVITDSPYDQFRPRAYHTFEVIRSAMLAYVAYSVDFADRGGGALSVQIFGLETQRNAWRVFSRSPRTQPLFKKFGGIPESRVAGLGLPLLDLKASDIPLEGLPARVRHASRSKFKVLYTPHHTPDGWSTFLKSGPHMRRLLEECSDMYLVFRPHPGLAPKLEEAGVMSAAELRSFFPADRSYVWEGDNYFDAFEWSDVLVSDASSFLVQYATTRKPIIYLHREDGWDIDDSIRTEILEGYYVARSYEDITAHLAFLRTGSDPLADVRYRCQERMSFRIFSASAGRRIARYLRESLS